MNKKYYSTISSLKPSRKAVDAAVANALRLEKSGKVIEMKPANNKKKLTAIGTIAASLALIIALGAVFFPHGNSLVLKVNAAELSDKSFSAIAKLNRDGGSHMITDEGAERKSEIITNDFAFDLDCVGDNIKSYTCEVKNGSFVIGDTTALADAVPAEKTYKAPFEKEYASFTAEAEAKIPEIRLITGIDLLDENLPKAVLRITGLDESIYYDDGYGKTQTNLDGNIMQDALVKHLLGLIHTGMTDAGEVLEGIAQLETADGEGWMKTWSAMGDRHFIRRVGPVIFRPVFYLRICKEQGFFPRCPSA